MPVKFHYERCLLPGCRGITGKGTTYYVQAPGEHNTRKELCYTFSVDSAVFLLWMYVFSGSGSRQRTPKFFVGSEQQG